MSRLKGIIFDLDGVIVDTAKYHFIAWRTLANSLGFDFDAVRNEQLKGVGRVKTLELILEWGGIEKSEAEKRQLALDKNEHYQRLIANMDEGEIFPGIADILKEAKSAGLKLALGSASKNARRILNYVNLISAFDVIVDGTNVLKAKPDPEVFIQAAGLMELRHNEVIVVEDSVKGIQAAKAAGMYNIGIGKADVLGMAEWVIPGFENISLIEVEDKFNNNKTR